jgi:hypothetical protein
MVELPYLETIPPRPNPGAWLGSVFNYGQHKYRNTLATLTSTQVLMALGDFTPPPPPARPRRVHPSSVDPPPMYISQEVESPSYFPYTSDSYYRQSDATLVNRRPPSVARFPRYPSYSTNAGDSENEESEEHDSGDQGSDTLYIESRDPRKRGAASQLADLRNIDRLPSSSDTALCPTRQGLKRLDSLQSADEEYLEPDDPHITGKAPDIHDMDPELLVEQLIRGMTYKQRRKERTRVIIEFNITCKCFRLLGSSISNALL